MKVLPAMVAMMLLGSSVPFLSASEASVAPVCIMGRTWTAPDGLIHMGFPGSVIEVGFTGTKSIKIIAGCPEQDKEAHFNVTLDTIPLERLEVKGPVREYVISDTLDKDEFYRIRLVRRTEAWQGVARFGGFVVDEGTEWLDCKELPERRFMFIGDSITGGDKNEYIPPFSHFGNHTHNAEMAFGWELGRRLEAQVHLVSYGGKGIVRDWSGNTEEVKAAEFFERAVPDTAEAVWDHALYQPDAVVICLGTNDFTPGVLDVEAYAAPYIRFVERILEVHPDARVVVCSSPMHNPEDAGWGGPRAKALEASLDAVVSHFNEARPDRVRKVKLGYRPGSKFDSHPIAPQHQEIADEFEPVLRDWLGW